MVRTHALCLSQPRRGAVALFLLLAFGLLLSLLALVIDGANLWSARQEAQTAADAAALAAVAALADDELLTAEPNAMAYAVERARLAAQQVGALNPVAGLPHHFDLNSSNSVDGDLVFGYLERAGLPFHPGTEKDMFDPHLNAVLVRAVRSQARGNAVPLLLGRVSGRMALELGAEAAAHLDRAVLGFRPAGRTAVPLVPLALFSDPTAEHPASFEYQAADPAADQWAYLAAERRFLAVGDGVAAGNGISEITLRLPLAQSGFGSAAASEQPNATLLLFQQAKQQPRHILDGLAAGEFSAWGGQLVLGWDQVLPLPGELFAPGADDPHLKRLADAFELLSRRAEPRIWPLYQAVKPAAEGEPVSIIVTDFIAARLATVRLEASPYPHLQLTLEPCQLVTNHAVTLLEHAEDVRLGLANRYLSKARLVR